MHMGGYGSYGRFYNMGYANNYYNQNQCMFGCPPNSNCRLGFCECNPGLTRTMVI